MARDPETGQIVEPEPPRRSCPVCQFDPEKNLNLKNCHSYYISGRGTESEQRDTGHQSIWSVEKIRGDLSSTLYKLERKVRFNNGAPIPAAIEAIRDVTTIPDDQPQRQITHEFGYLLLLQQFNVFKKYPKIKGVKSIRQAYELLTDHSEHAIRTAIDSQNLITKVEVYRSKVYSITPQFWVNAAELPTDPLTSRTLVEGERIDRFLKKNAAHSVVTAYVRNWLDNHPEIDWVVAPHMVAAEDVTKVTTPDDEAWSQPGAHVVFDCAAFVENPKTTLEVAGFVALDETLRTLACRLRQNRNREVVNLCVMPKREKIYEFLAALDREFCDLQFGPHDIGIADHYDRQPSITDVNNELTNWLPASAMRLKFMTIKQLIDEIVTPSEVLKMTGES